MWILNLTVVFVFGNFEDSGAFGDTFGAVNALFSGLAFVGLIYAILLQKNQLELQREDLKSTQEELIETREEFKTQNETLKIQRFENTFFSMLSLHNEITLNTTLKIRNGEEKGRDIYKTIYNAIYNDMNRQLVGDKNYPKEPDKETVSKYIDTLYQAQLGHYFRNLYTIFKYIDESKISGKELYTDIVRAQLSNYELLLLFYNCYFLHEPSEGFIEYAKEYNLFDNMPKDQLAKTARFICLFGNFLSAHSWRCNLKCVVCCLLRQYRISV